MKFTVKAMAWKFGRKQTVPAFGNSTASDFSREMFRQFHSKLLCGA